MREYKEGYVLKNGKVVIEGEANGVQSYSDETGYVKWDGVDKVWRSIVHVDHELGFVVPLAHRP